MEQIFIDYPILSILLTLVLYIISHYIYLCFCKIKITFIPPVIFALALVSSFLLLFDISYEAYNKGAMVITYLAIPATATLGLVAYRRKDLLKKYYPIIILSISIGIVCGFITTFFMAKYMFNLDYKVMMSLFSKSTTTPIAVAITENMGGLRAITVIAVFISGCFGAAVALIIFKIIRVNSPLAHGLALGNAAHAVGTVKAISLGKTEGSMSSLALTISAFLNVVFLPLLLKLFTIIFN